ncbi:sigma-54-dependent Fis family transcriptional regulator [Roseicella aquatilis]|uniref:Sigma-54-dependent Fis family transcriptional regulator n=1 Tax=Roseicella aquatilis TaxID=2527868 RepID=A0A4R4DKF7_9PROT|nr:sigma 54-interacting transcriptional regulator [Roseicella aquatilis]TCZ60896.1 sigma-54-dependent Fis family transcriptional regulator [Roseicella aquatilis]
MEPIELRELGSTDYARRVERAWERLLGAQPAGREGVRSLVLQSWRRCRALGVDPARRAAPLPAPRRDLAALQARDGRLAAALRDALPPVMPYLAETGSALILADATGALTAVLGGEPVAERLAENAAVPGAGWHEHQAGTNAIGTALALGRGVVIHGPEHFCLAGKAWSCAAQPLRDPAEGVILGVVDITGPAGAAALRAAPLVALLARQVEAELARREAEDRARLLDAFCAQRPDGDGLLLFDRRGWVLRLSGGAATAMGGLAPGRPVPGLDPARIARWELGGLDPALGNRAVPVREGGAVLGGILRLPAPRPAAPPPGAPPLAAPLHALAEASPSLLPLLRRAQALAERRLPILLQGETGTGKDALAAALHAATAGPGAPFVALNCAALPRELAGAELFGHAEGAFTGAPRGGRAGRFEEAQRGTILLDEIGDMPIELQPYLLRLLDERAVVRLGESRRRPLELRVIAATNRPLAEAVAAGRFRADLFHRLGGAVLELPPLRRRREDIPSLVRHLLAGLEGPAPEPEPALLALLAAQDWPGNIRELRHTLERLAAGLAPEEALHAAAAAPVPPRTLREVEREMILAALAAEGGSAGRAARALGLSRATLYRRLESYRAAG